MLKTLKTLSRKEISMSEYEFNRIIKKIYSDFKKKYPEEYKRQVEIQKKADEEFFNRLKAERSNNE